MYQEVLSSILSNAIISEEPLGWISMQYNKVSLNIVQSGSRNEQNKYQFLNCESHTYPSKSGLFVIIELVSALKIKTCVENPCDGLARSEPPNDL